MFAIQRFYSNQNDTSGYRRSVQDCSLLPWSLPMPERNCPRFAPASEQFRSAISRAISHHNARDEHLLSLFQVPELSQPI
jgi:hypothetical protein